MPDHAIQHESVGPLESPVLQVELVGGAGWIDGDGVVFGAKLRKDVAKEVELAGFVHVHPDELARLLPQRVGQGAGVRDGLVEVHRGQVKAVLLPQPEILCRQRSGRVLGEDLGEQSRELVGPLVTPCEIEQRVTKRRPRASGGRERARFRTRHRSTSGAAGSPG